MREREREREGEAEREREYASMKITEMRNKSVLEKERMSVS
jgi:hypothetical protein